MDRRGLDKQLVRQQSFRERVLAERDSTVARIKERSPEMLRHNFERALKVLKKFYMDQRPSFLQKLTEPIEMAKLQTKAKKFHAYFEDNLFNQVIHASDKDLGETAGLLSPEQLGRSRSSGQLDVEMGNTDYVFSNLYKLGSRSMSGSYSYRIPSQDGCVSARDIQDIVAPYEKLGIQRGKNLDETEAVKLHFYADNLFTIPDFKVYFSLYCAVLFDSPEEALQILDVVAGYTLSVGAWDDGNTIFDNPQHQAIVENMKTLYLNQGLVPPVSPEFMFKDRVVAQKVDSKSLGEPLPHLETKTFSLE